MQIDFFVISKTKTKVKIHNGADISFCIFRKKSVHTKMV